MNALSRFLFRLTPVLLGVSIGLAQPHPSAVGRALMLQPTKYRLRAGEAIKLEAAAETRDFLLKAKVRRASVPGFTRPGLVVAPNVAGDEVLLAASLTMAPGEYSVTVSATSEAGE